MSNPDPTASVKPPRRRRARRLAFFAAANLVFTAAIAGAAFVLGWSGSAASLPDLSAWHTDPPPGEFTAADARARSTLRDYLAQEARTFTELESRVAGPWGAGGETFSRFSPASVCNPGRASDRDWNRTFVLEAPGAAAGVLLLHGLSDSPYSFRALAQRLHREGYTVVALRLPGHGTCPGALARVSWRDWAAAARVAAAGLRDLLPAGAPIALGGFSTGGALALEYALAALDDPSLPPARAVVLFSPMVGITPLARITALYPAVARLSGQEKVAWSKVEAEIDPFKYCSWPVNASLQAWRLTARVEAGLAARRAAGRAAELPPILAMQSAVDSTVRVPDLVTRLFDALPPGPSELVLFDVNRVSWLGNLIDLSFERAIVPRLARPDLPFSLTVVTNTAPDSRAVLARSWRAGVRSETPLGLSWPVGVFSLSHAAIPIPPDDPILGDEAATAAGGLPLGTLSLRGENGVLAVSESLLIRQRFNPFYSYMEERVVRWLRAVLAGQPDAG